MIASSASLTISPSSIGVMCVHAVEVRPNTSIWEWRFPPLLRSSLMADLTIESGFTSFQEGGGSMGLVPWAVFAFALALARIASRPCAVYQCLRSHSSSLTDSGFELFLAVRMSEKTTIAITITITITMIVITSILSLSVPQKARRAQVRLFFRFMGHRCAEVTGGKS